MANSLITKKHKNGLLYRGYNYNEDLSETEYQPPSMFKVGVNNTEAVETDTNLDVPVPINTGTVIDNGSTTATTGSSSDNTTNYKEGAEETDVTSQNLLCTSQTYNAWDFTLGTTIDPTLPIGFWIYITESVLANLVNIYTYFAGSVTSNGYVKIIVAADLTTGWNWISTIEEPTNSLLETGDANTDLDHFGLAATFTVAQTLVAGDLQFDLLRQWEIGSLGDNLEEFSAGSPELDLTNNQITTLFELDETQANGFYIDSVGIFNDDDTPSLLGEDKFTGISKTSSDVLKFTLKDFLL